MKAWASVVQLHPSAPCVRRPKAGPQPSKLMTSVRIRPDAPVFATGPTGRGTALLRRTFQVRVLSGEPVSYQCGVGARPVSKTAPSRFNSCRWCQSCSGVDGHAGYGDHRGLPVHGCRNNRKSQPVSSPAYKTSDWCVRADGTPAVCKIAALGSIPRRTSKCGRGQCSEALVCGTSLTGCKFRRSPQRSYRSVTGRRFCTPETTV